MIFATRISGMDSAVNDQNVTKKPMKFESQQVLSHPEMCRPEMTAQQRVERKFAETRGGKRGFFHYLWFFVMLLTCFLSPFEGEGRLIGMWENAGLNAEAFPGIPIYFLLASWALPIFTYFLVPAGATLTFYRFVLWRLYTSMMISPVYWFVQHRVSQGVFELDWWRTITTSVGVWLIWGVLALVAYGIRKVIHKVKQKTQPCLVLWPDREDATAVVESPLDPSDSFCPCPVTTSDVLSKQRVSSPCNPVNEEGAAVNNPMNVESENRDFFAQAFREAQDESAGRDAGLWAMAFAQSDGDPARTQAAYVKLRVASLENERQKGCSVGRKGTMDAMKDRAFALDRFERRRFWAIVISTLTAVGIFIFVVFWFSESEQGTAEAYPTTAENGSAEEQFNLGRRYFFGEGVLLDKTEAAKWHRRAAEQGHADAQFFLGLCHADGEGVPLDKTEAAKWHRRAAEQGHVDEQFFLGICYVKGEGVPVDKKEAVIWFRKAADQGHAKAQFELGICYDEGRGVSVDKKETVKWYRRAAEQGLAQAQSNLGACYGKGEGVPVDKKEALKWYRKAAEQGDAQAQYNLGICYDKGEGVSVDIPEAVKWFKKAAEKGFAEAQYNLGISYDKGEGVPVDKKEAVIWFRRAAEQGDVDAQFNLGRSCFFGKGIPVDKPEAVKWFRKAADQGDVQAQFNLGVFYAHGEGVVVDPTEAAKWWRKAAEQGHADAQYMLGVCYVIGKGVPVNKTEAVKWYLKAAEQGHAEAKKALEELL